MLPSRFVSAVEGCDAAVMGRSHALSGAVVWLGGCALAAGLGARPAVGAVVVGAAVTAGGALLPDVDHPGSVVARSLGPLTRLIARGAAAGAAALRTASCGCCAGRGGHRAVTHTFVFAVTAGLLVSLLCWVGGDVAAAVVAGMAAALAVRGVLRRRTRGAYGAAGSGLLVGLMAAALPGPVAGWWWVGLPLGLGCLVHSLGDALTFSRVPLLWPIRIRGCRWAPLGMWAPLRFRTGSAAELLLVVPALMLLGVISAWTLITP
ncbi:metal-dependent hydrolase [Micromonospora sp. ALFpr18c]|uniref:metal-dependent hydrolase n=1 Tax=Micromonospora sp. ALFpr18c TaxID=1458665 RepID=UPI00124B380C|nr:metal-dependent hydrolase [Micromonospora sp. ALFpr18c]